MRERVPRTSRFLGLAAILLLALALARPAAAQPAKPAPLDAKALLREGNSLFNAGDYPAALDTYKKGYEQQPTPVFLRSMAYSLLKMRQHRQAAGLLQDYLKKFPKAPDRAKIKKILAGLAEVVDTRLEVTSTPPGADVYIDTEAGGKMGTTPFRGTVHPGTHTVILKAKGYRTTTEEVTVAHKETRRVAVALTVPLKISSTPKGAEVLLETSEGRRSLGQTPIEAGVVPGDYALQFKLPGYLTTRKRVTASPGPKPAEVSAELKLGVVVSSEPPGATVELDGVALSGKTPLEVGAAAGEHTITIKLAGFTSEQRAVTLTPDNSLKLHVKLVGSLLSMRTRVRGAKVQVGPVAAGTTPFARAPVPTGKRTVVVEHPDRRTWTGAMDFRQGQELQAELRLGRSLWPVWLAGGLTVAGIVAGSVTGVMAKSRVDRAKEENLCNSDGSPTAAGTDGDCGYGLHHASTASFIASGISAAVGVAYYLIWGRPSVTTRRTALSAANR